MPDYTRRWTAEEDQIIKECFLTVSVQDIADRLNRSRGSVYTRKYELGCTTDRRKNETRICKQCGSEFVVRPSSLRKFCGLPCAYANKDRIVERPIERPLRVCPQCGIEFRPVTSTVRSKHCSKKCSTDATRVYEERACTNCGTLFTVRSKSLRVCCSVACRRQRQDEATILKWQDKEFKQRMSDITSERHRNSPPSTPKYSNRKSGHREDLDGQYFRSAWEANVARYLNWLKSQGQIDRWEYEADTFWFEKIKRGVRSYKPDFKIWDTPDGEPYYWEVKGYDYGRGQTARKRMAKYFPKVKLVLIDEPAYKAIAKWKSLMPEWE